MLSPNWLFDKSNTSKERRFDSEGILPENELVFKFNWVSVLREAKGVMEPDNWLLLRLIWEMFFNLSNPADFISPVRWLLLRDKYESEAKLSKELLGISELRLFESKLR